MALKGGILTEEEKNTIKQFAETGGLPVIPLVAATLNRSEKLVMEYVDTLELNTPEPEPEAELSNRPQVKVQDGVTRPAGNAEKGVAIMTRAASERSDDRRAARPKTHPSHIYPCKREDG